MEQKKLSELTDVELLQEAKKMKTAKKTNALMIGFLAGIIVYSIMVNHIGWFTLIPLFLIYKLVNNSKYDSKELQQLIKERNLHLPPKTTLYKITVVSIFDACLSNRQ